MKTKIALFAFASLVATPAYAGKFNLSEYKTVAVQPVLSASNTRGQFESELAASASTLTFKADRATTMKQLGGRASADSGFGFAGKAQRGDLDLLFAATTLGIVPAAMREDAAAVKQKVPEIRQLIAVLDGKVTPKVIEALNLAASAIEVQDFQNTTKALLVAMALSADAITKGSERQHGYVAVGIYTGIASMFVRAGQPNKALADIGTPLVMLLEQDAALGGADRAIAVQLKVIAGELNNPAPDMKKVLDAITAMDAVKPD